MSLAEAAAHADVLAQDGDERALATMRVQWDEEIEAAARDSDYRVRAQAYRAIAQFRFRQKIELLRRGLEDDSPAARGSALIALEGLSRTHPGDVNAFRPLLHELAARDPNVAVRRLAVICLKNGSPHRDTLQLLEGLAATDDEDAELRKTATTCAQPAEEEGDGEVSVSVGVVMGSKSDWEVMENTVTTLRALEIAHEVRVLSAHRTPDALEAWIEDVSGRGCKVFVAAAGGAAHLAGVVASKTLLPVLGVPMGTALGGLDSLLSTVQMPAGIPVATLAIGRAGAVNAALFAAAILAGSDDEVRDRLLAYRLEQTQAVLDVGDPSA